MFTFYVFCTGFMFGCIAIFIFGYYAEKHGLEELGEEE